MNDDGMIYFLEKDLQYNMPDTEDVNLNIIKDIDRRIKKVSDKLQKEKGKISTTRSYESIIGGSVSGHGSTEDIAIHVADLQSHLQQLKLEKAAQAVILHLWILNHVDPGMAGSKLRVLLVYRYCDLLTYKQIAQRLDGRISESAVKVYISRGLKRLNLRA